MENKLLEAMKFRHAAKEFDTTKSIDEETFNQILEAGRLSPSSFGLEHTKFIVVENPQLKEKLQEASYNQKQVTTASQVVIILSRIKDVMSNSAYAKELFESRMPKEASEFLINFHGSFTQNFSEDEIAHWSKKQAYISAANMMTMAAYLGADSCPMEGFVESQVQEILGIDPKEYGVAMVLPFGYRNQEPRPKTRHELKEIVEFRK